MTIFTSFSHLWSQFTQWLAKIWLSSIWETKPKLIIWSILKNFECWPKKFEVCLLFCAVCLHFLFKHIYFFLRQNAGLMSMCSASLDIFTMMEARQGAEISQPMRFVYFFVKYIMFVYFFWMFYIKNYIFFSSNCRTLNSKKTSGTMGRHASTTSMKQKNKDLNPKRMHEEVNTFFVSFTNFFKNFVKLISLHF